MIQMQQIGMNERAKKDALQSRNCSWIDAVFVKIEMETNF